jgi:hypothetical protein
MSCDKWSQGAADEFSDGHVMPGVAQSRQDTMRYRSPVRVSQNAGCAAVVIANSGGTRAAQMTRSTRLTTMVRITEPTIIAFHGTKTRSRRSRSCPPS